MIPQRSQDRDRFHNSLPSHHRVHRRKPSNPNVRPPSLLGHFSRKLASRWGILALLSLLYLTWSFFSRASNPATPPITPSPNKHADSNPAADIKLSRPPMFPSSLLVNHAHDRHSHTHNPPENDADLRYCRNSPCRFLFPVYITEQESKSQQHLQQLALLAAALNRTLVLPNTGRGRLGSCARFPFNHYFSTSTIDSLAPYGVRYVTQLEFDHWAVERGEDVTAQFALLEREPKTRPASYKPPPLPNKQKLSEKFCLSILPFDYQKYPVIRHSFTYGYERSRVGVALAKDAIITALKDSAEAHGTRPGVAKDSYKDNAAVMLVHWQLKHAFLDVPIPGLPFEYHPRWHNITEGVVERLRPFVAIHWRMETVPPQNLPACAARLSAHLRSIRISQPLRTIYLATDYPLDGYARSATWNVEDVTEDHHEAIKILKTGTEFKAWMDVFREWQTEKSFLRKRDVNLEFEDYEDVEMGKVGERSDDDLFDGVSGEDFEIPVIEQKEDGATAQGETTVPQVTHIVLEPNHMPTLQPTTAPAAAPSHQLDISSMRRPLHPFDPSAGDDFDPGLLGILDKLVAVQAEYFLAGPPGCSKLSSFTAQIVAQREERMEKEGSWIENEAEGEWEENGEVARKTETEEEKRKDERMLRNVLDQW
ncbi:hypothetical protein BC937DRAFT_92303 [Endogone sp. FLAS-F59071]|nr:hypothetical protein BC937DRAFT_92303 [Endogone sp. FLAS-F59071]|eukprot:RUS21549.1 hypothetical protein BC937DRAFT_92303 [Endogone sp. FLAS-F59071]